MPDVIGICDTCGAMLNGVNVYRDGEVRFDPAALIEHRRVSFAGCKKAAIVLRVDALRVGQGLDSPALTPGDPRPEGA